MAPPGKISYLHAMLLLVVACFLLGIVFQVVYTSIQIKSFASSLDNGMKLTKNLYTSHKADMHSEVSRLMEEEKRYGKLVRETQSRLVATAEYPLGHIARWEENGTSAVGNNLRGADIGDKQQIIANTVSAPSIKTHISSKRSDGLGVDTVLLIIASNRPQYLEQCLRTVIDNYPYSSSRGFPVIVSEDGTSREVEKVVSNAREDFSRRFGAANSDSKAPSFLHIHHPPGDSDGLPGPRTNGYFKLAYHFKWAIDNVFGVSNNNYEYSKTVRDVNRVIILEEDLLVATDFFEYFGAVAPMLHSDPTLLAASAFNDNGFDKMVRDADRLYRTDFFPGLGWMCTRDAWIELSVKWPRAYWDDWLREPKNRKGRNFIRPEISRTFHIGKIGVSNAQFGNFLETVKLNEKHVFFTQLDLGYLSKQRWDNEYLGGVYGSALVATIQTFESVRTAASGKAVTLFYDSLEGPGASFVSLARWAGCMDNIKAGVPRTAYSGVVTIWKDGVAVHIAPRNRQE